MPKMVLLAEFVSIGGNDLSTYANKAEVTVEVEEKDVTTYGSLGWKEVLGGLKSGQRGPGVQAGLRRHETGLDHVAAARHRRALRVPRRPGRR
jgi:hypothetical protein